MSTAAKLTRENRTITVDFQNETIQIPPDSYETKTPLSRSGREKAP